jgi:hypothetical protein
MMQPAREAGLTQKHLRELAGAVVGKTGDVKWAGLKTTVVET